MAININTYCRINKNGSINISTDPTFAPPQTFANYSIQLSIGLLQADTVASLSGIQFTPSGTNITVPPELVNNGPAQIIYTSTGPIVSNIPITLTLNKGTLDFAYGYQLGNVYLQKNGVIQSGIPVSEGPDSYTFNVTADVNDNIIFIVSTYND